MDIVISLVGIFMLLSIAYAFSTNRKEINFRTVFGALAIQLIIGATVLFFPFGKQILASISDGVSTILGYSKTGIDFLFGPLVSDKMGEVFGGAGFIFALKALPVMVFFSSLVAVLYHLGVMQLFIKIIGGTLQRLLGTSKKESMSAAANIFVGQTEAPLVIGPYIHSLSRSELFAVMCGGLASIAGTVLGGFAAMGINMEYLIAASFMAAPGGLLFAKILLPESSKLLVTSEEQILTEEDEVVSALPQKPANIIDAAASGASTGASLAINVGAMLLAFIGLISLLNGLLGYIGGHIGMPTLSLELIFGYIFYPVALMISIPVDEAMTAANFIGQKLVLNEFVAFSTFNEYSLTHELSEKSKIIITFALCGFANFSAAAMLLGGLGTLAPKRRSEISRLCVLAVLAGTLSNLMSAAIAGLFFSLA